MPIMDIIVYAAAGFFLIMGIVTLIKPRQVTDAFRVPVISSDMRNEIRAVYGGFGVAMCAILLATFRYPDIRDGVFLTVVAALLGMAAGRIIGFVIERPGGPHPYIYFTVEVVLSALLLYARTQS